jgi:hypothetical protein
MDSIPSRGSIGQITGLPFRIRFWYGWPALAGFGQSTSPFDVSSLCSECCRPLGEGDHGHA